MGSYTGAHIDFYDFKTKKARHLVSLADECGQERPNQLVQAPDGMIYTVTSPVKGHLEGAIARIDPATLEVKAWAGIVPDQCFMSVVPIAATGELLLTGSTRGGTSALPKATEASLVIWDPKQEKVVWKGEPLKGTTVYAKGAAAKNGLVYIVTAERKYLAFDPVKREMVFSGDLPATGAKASGLKMVDDAAGPDGLIYGLMDDAVFAIDPADHSCRIVGHHPSIARKFEDALHGTLAEWSAADGTLYYGSGSELWRMVPAASR